MHGSGGGTGPPLKFWQKCGYRICWNGANQQIIEHVQSDAPSSPPPYPPPPLSPRRENSWIRACQRPMKLDYLFIFYKSPTVV